MTTSTTKKTPNELQLAEGQIENYVAAGLSIESTQQGASMSPAEACDAEPGECPDWCEIDSDTGEGTVHTALGGREEGRWVVEYGFEDHDPANSRRPWVFANITDPSDELTPVEALAMGKALIRAAEQLGATS